MRAEQLQKAIGHWRVTLFSSAEEGSILFCVDECIFCNFRIVADGYATRTKQREQHENSHPREAWAREFLKFRQALHGAMWEKCCFYGIKALKFDDREEWEIHFRRFKCDDSGHRWSDYISSVLGEAKDWKYSADLVSNGAARSSSD
jgi:hypothetical protein